MGPSQVALTTSEYSPGGCCGKYWNDSEGVRFSASTGHWLLERTSGQLKNEPEIPDPEESRHSNVSGFRSACRRKLNGTPWVTAREGSLEGYWDVESTCRDKH